MRINNLLAVPGFKFWMEGEPLDIGRLLYNPKGKPRASIFTINHLSEYQCMFFVTMLPLAQWHSLMATFMRPSTRRKMFPSATYFLEKSK